MSVPDADNPGLVERTRRMLADPITWKSLAYVLLEFPFSIFSFSLTITLLATAVGLLLSPIAYLGAALFDPAFPGDAFQGSGYPGPGFASSPVAFQTFAVLVVGVVGLLLTVLTLVALNGIGILWGKFAELMLGVDETRLQLVAARAEVKVEHERAEVADRSRRELIVNASHELRTPVASISAHVESLLKPGREMDDETRNYLTVVAAETKRLGDLVDDVMTLARADTDELRLDVRPTDVETVIRHVCDVLAPLARRERNLSLVHASPSGLPRAMADRERLTQVLTNIVRNAVNHTPEGGIISVDALALESRVNITVSDTGIGMEPEELEHIFDRFYRTDDSRARDAGGSGLGLSIVRELLTAMGGSIEARSTPGHGSVFTVSLLREAS
jgi:signal transduction histidine kinase